MTSPTGSDAIAVLTRRHGVGWPWITSCCSELYHAASTARAATTTTVGSWSCQREDGREPGRDAAPHGDRRPLDRWWEHDVHL